MIRGLNINIEQDEMKVADSVTYNCLVSLRVMCIRKKNKLYRQSSGISLKIMASALGIRAI